MIEIAATVAHKIGFASHQNAVPLIAELSLVSDAQEPVDNLVLKLSASPPFIEARTWTIDRIGSDSTLHIKDRVIRLDGSFLFELNESVNGEISIVLERKGETLTSQTFPVELLARSEWGGRSSNAGIAPCILPSKRSRSRSSAQGRIRCPTAGR
jgi:hypothetical protein